MRSVQHIADSADPRLEDYRHLRERDLRRSDEGLFVGEQWLVVERMLAVAGLTRSVLIGAPFVDRFAPLVPADVPLLAAPMELIESIAGFQVHRGVLAIGRRDAVAHRSLAEIAGDIGEPRTLLVCEDITHLDNIGLLFRNAAAFGAEAVLLSPRCHDPLYRKSLRVSIGHAVTTPWRRAASWPDELESLRRDHGFTVVGTALDAARPLDEVARPKRVALLVGTEISGLAPTTRACCDVLVRIPMAPDVDSLNVAAASAVCLHRFATAARR